MSIRPRDTRFSSQLRGAFLLGMAMAIAAVIAIGSSEKAKLHAALGPSSTAPRAAQPVTFAR